MEVATTNNHSQSHHHHHHHHRGGAGGAGGGGGAAAAVAVGGGSRSPFQREVREWQRIDPDTGALFSGRLEADRWINGPMNSYGKISDSQNISQPNGTQHTQRKQLEVLRTANGAMQVIRTQTVQKTSSTSRWSTSTSSSTTATTATTATSATTATTWAPKHSQGVDICELSDDDHDDHDDDDDSIHNDSDAGVAVVIDNESPTASMAPSYSHGQELVDDHVDFVVINGNSDADDRQFSQDKLGHNLLPDTAPSLKLSNLMKSSSSISSQSSNNSNLTTATATATATTAAVGNTHRNAAKISLHAIVGQTTTTTTKAAATTTKTTTPTPSSLSSSSSSSLSTWPKSDLYGQNNNSNKRRVGVLTEAAGDADVAVVVATPTLRRDLESFRHYNDDAATKTSKSSTTSTADNDADDLRLSARHQRRQQVSQSVYAPPLNTSALGCLQRSRSISTDDLSNDWQQQEHHEEEEPCGDWRRVSKLRRSFQSQDYHKVMTRPRPRPLDLPSSSVSVARIRAELENGRRLNTAMRNNHVDLAALDNILNPNIATPVPLKPQVAKRSTFLTAESLQEIRGKLKKLSDESLYREDFVAHHQASSKPSVVEVLQAPEPAPAPLAPLAPPSAFRPVHNTHSLETRQRPKDTSSSEWHLRRKSYGFEKMSPPENRSIFRVDASTDSGLGRSGEQLGNWSPTERTAASANGPGSTIIHFGRQQPTRQSPDSPNESELSKRHSIAVEETWRDIRKTSQVHVNGEPVNGINSSSQLQRSSAQKRVEFCKTEVHFAAESGRVNIVETDGKPPPTQNFRRRRRTASGPLQSLVKSASVSSSSSSTSSSSTSNVTHFGDDPTVRGKTIASSTVAYRATLMEPTELITQPVAGTQVTVITTTPKPILEPRYSLLESTSSTSRHSYTSTSGVDTTDNETDELANIRGILKNKPIKPKPYHLGENIESADVLWSVPATIKSERESSPPGREIATGDSPITTKSVAERVRIVEQRQFDKQQLQQQQQQQQQSSPAGNGYSTKINVSLGAEEWPETDLPKSNVMNIALHAPRLQKPKPTPPTLRIGQLVPVAKPRTLLVQPQPVAQPQLTTSQDNADESGSESLKIVKEARGARKLREHELSYFGVQHSPTPQHSPAPKLLPATPNPRRTLPTRSKVKQKEEEAATATTTTTTRWQLLNDRPDLLRHSPQGNDETNDYPEDDEHCYENIANELTTTFRVKSPSPGSYERKTDLQRDAQILSEMTRNADQTMKALSDEAAFKDQRRRSCSLQRRSAKPLATINEKAYNGDVKALSVARGTFSSEARRNSRQSTPSPTRARSSSQSSIECCPRDRSRSSSRESMTQGGGSSDDQMTKQRVERMRMRTPKREKTRHEPTEQRSARQSSKPRIASNAAPESKRSHHHSRHREKEHVGEHSAKHHSGSVAVSASGGTRLLRSSRVSEESRPRTSSHRTSERERERERSRGSEKHREELSRSRGHSSRSRHSEQTTTTTTSAGHKSSKSSRSHNNDTTTSSAHRKSTAGARATTTTKATTTTHKASTATPTPTTTPSSSTAAHNELTYVYVTNLANTQTAEDADYASIDEAAITPSTPPLPPPRRKRKQSLIPVLIPMQRERAAATPTAAYEHRTKLEMIPVAPSYSNQSTLRCKAKSQPRKPSLKCTQSTRSSFSFLPYLPAKRNSSVSHVYDNYLLYAAPATLTESKLRPYQHNLINDHAQLFGSSGRGGVTASGLGNGAAGALASRLGNSWPKRLRMRQVRSSVSTHQPFGICTCS